MSFLLFTAGARLCAMSVRHVTETLRPLPVEPATHAPVFVTGLALLRGVPTPIVDTGLLLGDAALVAPGRLVAIRTEDGRAVGLLATAVLGLRSADAVQSAVTIPLLADDSAFVEGMGRLDRALLTVLRAGRLLAADVT